MVSRWVNILLRITPTLSLPLKMALARSRISTPKLTPSINSTFLTNFQAKGKGFFYRSFLSSINIIICSNPHSKANTKTESELSPTHPSNITPRHTTPSPLPPLKVMIIVGLAIAVGLICCCFLRSATQRSNTTSHAPMHLQHLSSGYV